MDIEFLSQIVDYGVLGLLGFMSFLTLFFWIERLLFYRGVEVSEYSTQEALELDITNNLGIISSFGANAPYIGLLGTVLAIMQTFVDMSKENLAATKIMASLALALKTTAIGLFVAIVSIVFYNYLTRKVETFLAHYEA